MAVGLSSFGTPFPYGGQVCKIGGGGFATGIDIANDGTLVCRTDSGGAYVWNASISKWVCCTTLQSMASGLTVGNDWYSDVLEIRVAPSNSQIMYMINSPTVGTGVTAATGIVWKSIDQGKTWNTVFTYTATGQSANDFARYMGQKLAIDPANPNVVYFGSGENGVYVTTNGGVSWTQIPNGTIAFCTTAYQTTSFPGHPGICFDPTSGTDANGHTKTIYVPTYGVGVYQSTDAGNTWTLLAGSPTTVCHAKVGPLGTYFCATVTSSVTTRVYKYKTSWTNISSGTASFSANTIITVSPDPLDATEQRLLFSSDGGVLQISTTAGASWGAALTTTRVATDCPWLAFTNEGYMTLGDQVFDGLGNVIFAEGIGVWKAPISGTPSSVTWTSMTAGIENLVPTDICWPPGGSPVTTVLDRFAFQITDPTNYATQNLPSGTFELYPAYGVDYASSDPNTIVVNAQGNNPAGKAYGFFTNNGGTSWSPIAGVPASNGSGAGAIACSTALNWVTLSGGQLPCYTLDGGNTWTQLSSFSTTAWNFKVVAADRVNANTFYLFQNSSPQAVYMSTNGGATWTTQFSGTLDGSAAVPMLKSVPGQAGHLFYIAGPSGGTGTHPGNGKMMFSSNAGVTWTRVGASTNVSEPGCMALGGKLTTSQTYLTIYYYGYYLGQYGVWYSLNFDPTSPSTAAFQLLMTSPCGCTDRMKNMAADPNNFGRLIMGFNSSGYFYSSF